MINIKPFKQSDDSRCGPACIKMALDYYGIEASEDELCERCDHTYELGCTNVQMKEALEAYGLSCNIKEESNFEQLTYFVNRNIPVIVDWFSVDCGHSSVVVDLDEEYIYLADPELGEVRKMLREEFMRVWFDWKSGETISCEELSIREMIVVWK